MLFKKIIGTYYSIGIILYIIAFIAIIGVTNKMILVSASFIYFVIFGLILKMISNQNNQFYNIDNFYLITTLQSFVALFLFMFLSYWIDGDTYLFSKADALYYHRDALEMSSLSFNKSLKYLIDSYGFDDWGGAFVMSLIFRIYPSKLLLNLFFCVLGIVSSGMIFKIGRLFMSNRYAFICALSFSLASFTITYYTMFLKETIMIFIILSSFYFFYKYLKARKIYFVLISFIIAGLLVFFRLPTMLLLMGALFATLILVNVRNKVYLIPLIVIVLITSSFFASFFEYTFQRYLAGGDVEQIVERKVEMSAGGGLINHIADPLAALIGPFPSFIPRIISSNCLNASGLLIRLLLAFPFLMGVYYAVKYKKKYLYPLILFFLLEAIGVAISVKGLEFRLTFPHLAMAYLVAFWTLFLYDYKIIKRGVLNKYWNYWVVCVVFICVLWNIRYLV